MKREILFKIVPTLIICAIAAVFVSVMSLYINQQAEKKLKEVEDIELREEYIEEVAKTALTVDLDDLVKAVVELTDFESFTFRLGYNNIIVLGFRDAFSTSISIQAESFDELKIKFKEYMEDAQ